MAQHDESSLKYPRREGKDGWVFVQMRTARLVKISTGGGVSRGMYKENANEASNEGFGLTGVRQIHLPS